MHDLLHVLLLVLLAEAAGLPARLASLHDIVIFRWQLCWVGAMCALFVTMVSVFIWEGAEFFAAGSWKYLS